MSSEQNESMKCICDSEHCTCNQHLTIGLLLSFFVVILIPILPSKDSSNCRAKCRIERVSLKANDQKNAWMATILTHQLWLHQGPSLPCV